MDALIEQQNLERFGEAVLADPELHKRLRATDGIMDFAQLAVELGTERGYQFSVPAVQAAVQQKRRAWLERWL